MVVLLPITSYPNSGFRIPKIAARISNKAETVRFEILYNYSLQKGTNTIKTAIDSKLFAGDVAGAKSLLQSKIGDKLTNKSTIGAIVNYHFHYGSPKKGIINSCIKEQPDLLLLPSTHNREQAFDYSLLDFFCKFSTKLRTPILIESIISTKKDLNYIKLVSSTGGEAIVKTTTFLSTWSNQLIKKHHPTTEERSNNWGDSKRKSLKKILIDNQKVNSSNHYNNHPTFVF